MKAKKLMAMLGVLVIAVPSMALAADDQITTEVVEGHTVFAAVLDETKTDFAAIAGIAAKRTTMGAVLWFNDQELIPASVASEIAAGAYVIATEAGDDPPSEHLLDALYTESYQFTDPNNRVWLVDRYTYDVCTVEAGGGLHIVPCDADDAEEGALRQDLDGDNDDDLGVEDTVIRTTKSIFVVEIGATTVDVASSCGTATGEDYNFVILVRMDALNSAVTGGKQHGASSTDSILQGNSHAGSLTPAPDHSHDTAQIDLWFSEDRPPVPGTGRAMFFPEDTVGDAAPCYAP